jgi:hypothetical protein
MAEADDDDGIEEKQPSPFGFPAPAHRRALRQKADV